MSDRDRYDQTLRPLSDAEFRALAILEEVCSPDVRPERSLLAYLEDIIEALGVDVDRL